MRHYLQPTIDSLKSENDFLSDQLTNLARDYVRLRKALEHYKAADDEIYRMLAGFNAKPSMEDPNSIAGKVLRESL